MDKNFVDEAVNDLSTVQDMIRWAMSRFNEANLFFGHGTDNAWDEAVHLVLPSLYLPLDADPEIRHARLTQSERQKVAELVVRRVTDKTPVPYLINKAWFAGLEFYVDERVLVPRSPFAELIHGGFTPWLTKNPSRVLDLCTGSACIAIACAYAFEQAEVDAVDISDDALEVAEMNIQDHGLEQQVIPLKSDLFNEIKNERYDLIVSNPPYVDAEDMANLPDEFHHEPELGLVAGGDGLDLVRRILANGAEMLNEQGIMVVEVGNSQIHLEQAYPDVPFTWIEFEHGGHGVFMLTKQQLDHCQAQFSLYKD